ncbi:MAG: hypothetical protein P9E24_04335 [Candidatus Competibacter sp.]|nr:hypothetical protein [Candidatus Competibacter sp.]MDG4584283.1 hypothetical protein [Candidatus Competibacter sp.]
MQSINPEDIFDQTQSALLWLGLDLLNPPHFDPNTEVTKSVMTISRMFQNAAEAGRLKFCNKVLRNTFKIETALGPTPINQYDYYFTVEELVSFAKRRKEKPAFIDMLNSDYQDSLPERQDRLHNREKQGVYQILAALWQLYYGDRQPDDLAVEEFLKDSQERFPLPKDKRTIERHLKTALSPFVSDE